MHCTKKITDDIFFIGANDRRLELFENVFPIPKGVSYNSYVVLDEKITVMDTADSAVSKTFFENLEYILQGKIPDYLVINHMEPDHCACVKDFVAKYPNVSLVGNVKTFTMLKNFFGDIACEKITVKEGDTLNTGKHTFNFVMAPMVHWPEAMVTFDSYSGVLFSADAFGTFGALNGNIFADEVDFERDWLDDARRYYTNIVGKYGAQVQALLKKAAGLDIKMICPLHGPVWRENIAWFVEKYEKWSSYTPEENSVLIVCGSIYGNTENAAEAIAAKLWDKGVKATLFNASNTDVSYLVSESFKYSFIIIAAATYNGGIYTPVENYINEIKLHNLQNRKFALVENGSWAPMAAKTAEKLMEGMKNIDILPERVSIKSSLCDEAVIDDFCTAVANQI